MNITIADEDFGPKNTLPDGLALGSEVAFIIRGRVTQLKQEIVDQTGLGAWHEYRPGAKSIDIHITEIKAA